jgi:hypothetical protein
LCLSGDWIGFSDSGEFDKSTINGSWDDGLELFNDQINSIENSWSLFLSS